MADRRWLWALGLVGLAVLVGIAVGGSSSPSSDVSPPAGGGTVVEQGTTEGVDYQIRRDSGGELQGWVLFEGKWAQLDEARSSDLTTVRKAIEEFVDRLHSGSTNPSVNQLQAQLEDAGVRHFTARELLRIRHPSIAGPLGFEGRTFTASPTIQARLVEVARVADELRDLYGGPLTVLNGYRPKPYNDKVTDAKNSQHIYGRAIDLTGSDLPRLRRLAYELYEAGKVRGLGLYAGNVHIDTRTGSPRVWGSRKGDFV